MKLPRLLLRRIRRKLRRLLDHPVTPGPAAIPRPTGERTSHHSPPDKMKTPFLIILGLVLILFTLGMSSCAGLAGTTIEIGDDGIVITPPPRPIVLPLK